MSAACVAVAVPTIAATNRNRRIATLPSHADCDHRSLTLTNRCRGPFERNENFSNHATQNKTARENPAPLRDVKMSETDQPLRISGAGAGTSQQVQRTPSLRSCEVRSWNSKARLERV